jgi:hypothetical protein
MEKHRAGIKAVSAVAVLAALAALAGCASDKSLWLRDGDVTQEATAEEAAPPDGAADPGDIALPPDAPGGDGGDAIDTYPVEVTEADAGDARDFDAARDPDAVDETSDPPAEDAAGDGPIVTPGLPAIHNHSTASAARAIALVRAAVDGLGFGAGSVQGPVEADKVFVGRYYLAWIDQTGFYGKMNGLWRMNGAAGDALDFVLKDGARPVSSFIVGESGDGRWPPGYRGAEHIEFPSRTPESDDSAACASRDWCNQYGLNEGSSVTDPDIPWWSACNAGAPGWGDLFPPVVESPLPGGGLKLVYRGRLVKQADGDGRYNGDACHEDWLFPDGVRRPVWLLVGYELFGDRRSFDRTMQIENPAGNPAFDGPMSLIGGFVMTSYPTTHPLKRIGAFLRPEAAAVSDPRHGTTLQAGQWNAHGYPASSSDEVFAWMNQPFSMSVTNAYAAGQSFTLSHVGPSDNADVGICFCAVHGSIEMGGGLIHGGVSLPIAGGASTIEARRRLELPGTGTGAAVVHVYQAESDLNHNFGRADADGWSANTAADAAGTMLFGPYATDWGGLSAHAVFDLMVDNNRADNGVVVTLDIYDADADRILVIREVRRRELAAPFAYQGFALDADLAGRAGHRMEARVYWHDISYVRVDKVTVTTVD